LKKRIIISLLFVAACAVSAFSMGHTSGNGYGNGNHGGGNHQGGGGTPEPATMLLILGGAGAAYAVKKYKDR